MFVNAFQDFIVNSGSGVTGHGQFAGNYAQYMESVRWESGLLRPYFNRQGKRCVTINTGRMKYDHKLGRETPERKEMLLDALERRGFHSPVANATMLRKEEWIELDRKLLLAARYRLTCWEDLRNANSFGGFNGMGKLILEHENMSDPGEAIVDMDGLSEGRTDAPLFGGQGLPLPITHSDFWFSERRLAASRNTGVPLDMTMGEAGARRIAETLEKTTIGNQTGAKYGGLNTALTYTNSSQVYGFLTFPQRLTASVLRKPTGVGWTPAMTVSDVLGLVQQLRNNKFFGPFMLYHSNDWDTYLDNDYFTTAGVGSVSGLSTKTLRERLKAIKDIQDVKRLDMLFSSIPAASTGPGGENVTQAYPFTMILVQMTSEVARAVVGMDITTLQWPSLGGLRTNFKTMCICVPQLRADQYGNCGILSGIAA